MNEILKILRRQLDLTQKEFAEKINTTRGSIAQIEAGNNNVSFQLSHRINEVFQINLDDLIVKDGYLYNKNTNELLILSDSTNNETKITNTEISVNDLAVINKEYGFFPDMEVIKSYLTFSETQLKNILSSKKTSLKDKIATSNNISLIANTLLLNRDTYYKHRFTTITEKEYMEKMVRDYSPSTTSFENVKLKWITLIYQFESDDDHLSYIIADKIRYLKSAVDSGMRLGFLKLDEEKANKLSDR